MLANGDTTGGAGVIVYGMLIVGLVDNILRFTFLKKLENIHPLNTIFGIILGLKIFGFLGLIFGPILVSITILLMQIYADEFSDNQEDIHSLVTEEGNEISHENTDFDI
jgi:predicted PurR-regulated permease PerM